MLALPMRAVKIYVLHVSRVASRGEQYICSALKIESGANRCDALTRQRKRLLLPLPAPWVRVLRKNGSSISTSRDVSFCVDVSHGATVKASSFSHSRKISQAYRGEISRE